MHAQAVPQSTNGCTVPLAGAGIPVGISTLESRTSYMGVVSSTYTVLLLIAALCDVYKLHSTSTLVSAQHTAAVRV